MRLQNSSHVTEPKVYLEQLQSQSQGLEQEHAD